MSKFFFTLFSFLFLYYSFTFAQNTIILLHSDSIVGYKLENKHIRDFIGNVRLQHNDITIHCNKAIHFVDYNKAQLIGRVSIVRDSLVLSSEFIEFDGNTSIANSWSEIVISDYTSKLRAKRGIYNFRSNIAEFFDSVTFQDEKSKLEASAIEFNRKTNVVKALKQVRLETDTLVLICDSLINNRKDGKYFAFSNVKLISKSEPFELFSNYLFYNRNDKFSLSYGNPFIIIKDTISEMKEDSSIIKIDTMFIQSDTISFSSTDDERFNFFGNVKIFKNRLSAIGEDGEINKSKNYGRLNGNPKFWYDSTEFRGDSIFFTINDRRIDYIELIKNAFVLSPSNFDSAYINKIFSDTIAISFYNNEIRTLIGKSNSKTAYFIKNEDSGEILLVNYESDSIKIFFRENEVENVVWYGNVLGEVIPDIIFEKNLEKFYTYPKDFFYRKPKKILF
ncbi:MAG: hypothetical protein N2517_00350 [Ignavibacteria bacterium]|nr:hypothetical protein [Ignavibacteria bacterium]